MATTNYSWILPTVGGSEDTWGTELNTVLTAIDTLLGGTDATEFAILDGATVTTAELNLLDGVTWTPTALNGLTATVTEINYVDGVTSAIQTQLDGKQTLDATLTALAGTLTAANKVPYATALDTAGELDLETTLTDVDTALPTSGAVVDYVASLAIGEGQTWQDVLASRSDSTSYQNTTGRPISISIGATNTTRDVQVSSDNATWLQVGEVGTYGRATTGVIIPNNWYYRVNGSTTLDWWLELR